MKSRKLLVILLAGLLLCSAITGVALAAGTFNGSDAVTGITMEDADDNGNLTVTFTNAVYPLTIYVVKVWEGVPPPDGWAVDFTLSDGQTLTINAGNNDGSAHFDPVPRYDFEGNEIAYSVTEDTSPDWYELEGASVSAGGGAPIAPASVPFSPPDEFDE